jgi:hypothetical protein
VNLLGLPVVEGKPNAAGKPASRNFSVRMINSLQGLFKKKKKKLRRMSSKQLSEASPLILFFNSKQLDVSE